MSIFQKKKIITIQIKNHQVNTLCGHFLLTLRQKVSSDPLHATVHTSTAAPSEYSFRTPARNQTVTCAKDNLPLSWEVGNSIYKLEFLHFNPLQKYTSNIKRTGFSSLEVHKPNTESFGGCPKQSHA